MSRLTRLGENTQGLAETPLSRLTLLAFQAVDPARLTTVVHIRPECAFRLILQQLHIASIAPVHILRVIAILELLGTSGLFRTGVIRPFDRFRETARAHTGVIFFLYSLIVLGRVTPAGVAA